MHLVGHSPNKFKTLQQFFFRRYRFTTLFHPSRLGFLELGEKMRVNFRSQEKSVHCNSLHIFPCTVPDDFTFFACASYVLTMKGIYCLTQVRQVSMHDIDRKQIWLHSPRPQRTFCLLPIATGEAQ